MGNFKYIRKTVTAEITEKKSRFIATLTPVENEEEALAFIASIKKKYYDARHNCYAYITGNEDEFIHASDDGEPAHTAGRPMLDILIKSDLHKVCVTVTRYFGGILLGTGGLVRAYSDALKAAIEEADIYELTEYLAVNVKCDYSSHGKITNYALKEGLRLSNPVYNENVEFDLMISPDDADACIAVLTDITGGRAAITVGEKVLM